MHRKILKKLKTYGALMMLAVSSTQVIAQEKIGLSCNFSGNLDATPFIFLIDFKNKTVSQDQKFFGPLLEANDDLIKFQMNAFFHHLNRWDGRMTVFDKNGIDTKLWFKCSKTSRAL